VITDYKSYKELKWKYFLKWIRRSRCLEDRPSEALPQFVSFGGLFASLLMTPNLCEDWTLLVSKFKETIFMNKIRFSDHSKGRHSRDQSLEPSLTRETAFVDKNPYFAAKVTQIVTKSDEQVINRSVNEFEKCFNCFETQIGGHRLLLMSEMDAIDEDDNQYDIKCSKNMVFGQKLLNWWSQCVVADIDFVMVGIKDNENVLKEIRRVKVSEIPEMVSFRWKTDESFAFVNRFLDYMKDVMKDCKDLDVFRVQFRKRDKCVRSSELTVNTLLPNWFTSAEEWDQWDHQFDTQTVRI